MHYAIAVIRGEVIYGIMRTTVVYVFLIIVVLMLVLHNHDVGSIAKSRLFALPHNLSNHTIMLLEDNY